MSKEQGKSRKPLIIGIIAAVVILAALLAVLLTQCKPQGADQTEATTTVPGTTAPAAQVAEDYDLYWNVDRALYDGMSEAGMSSRVPAEDGYFYVRFFHDGEIVELRVADRKTVNALEVKDLMGLVFDDNGIVVDVIDIKEMPCEMVAWQFYVQSAGGNLIKTNSSASLNGMEVLLETNEDTGIWDMTGLSGEVGCEATPISYDRILGIADQSGKVTHVFIYARDNYMRTHEAECEHCGKVVEWSEWTKETAIPTMTGHYQLMNDITTGGQTNIVEDGKICLDLNGKRIDGKANARVYSLHNVGAELAIMDTSEEKTGTIAAHGKGDQGMCVWLRYGVVYLYDGILDGSDATSIKNGCTVALQANTYMYMHGGEIIGGTSTYLKNDKGKYTNGLGGSIYVGGKAKLVMNDGIIRDGYAESVPTKYDEKGRVIAVERGYGGNVFLSSGCVFEFNGGVIKNGRAGNAGGNVHADGTCEFTMNGGKIQGGKLTTKGKNGGSVYISSKSVFTMNDGSITGGVSYNCAGNLYLNGTVTMNGGYIGGGKCYNWSTGKLTPDHASRNVFVVNGNFAMYGGSIDGGVQAIDTNAQTKETIVVLSGYATISSKTAPNLTISTGGSGVKVIVGTLRDSAKIGVKTSMGLFTTATKEENTDNFYSDIAGADIVYYDGRIGLGRLGCLCGETEHLPGCDGKQLFWAPWTAKDTLPTTTGNYYLLNDVTCGQQNVTADAIVNLDLNGKTVQNKGGRIYSMHYRVETVTGTGEDAKTTYSYPAHLTVTDTSEGHKGVMKAVGTANHQGGIAWLRYGNVTLINGTFDASGYQMYSNWNAGKDGLYGTSDDQTTLISGGAFSVPGGRTLTIYGGTIIGGETIAQEQTKTNTIPVPEGAPEGTEPTTEEVKKTVAAGHGGALDVTGTVYMYGGTIRDGVSGATAGNVRINSGGKFYMYGGQILDGTSKGNGGNIQLSGLMEIHGGLVSGGWSKNVAGNFHVSPGTLTIYGGKITGGKVGAGGSTTTDHANIYTVNGKLNLHGGTIEGYTRVINYNTNGAEKGSVITISGNPVVAGGKVNLVLAPQGDKPEFKPTMPIVQVVGPMTEGANVQVNQATVDVDFAAGNGYTVTDADGKYFYYNGTDTTAVADTESNTLFFGRYGCLCGKEEHTFGCQQVNGGKSLKWRAWQSTTTLPTGGNWYLVRAVNGSGSTTVKRDSTLNLDLNGQTVTWKWRAYRIYDANAVANATLTITNTAETVGTIQSAEYTGQDQGTIVWVAGGEKGTFNLLDGVVLDASKYTITNVPSESNGAGTCVEKNGGAVAIQSGGTFNMYGGTVIGANAERSAEITLSNGKKYTAYAPNGANVAVTSGYFNMYGGEIKDGRTANQGGNVLISNTKFYMYGGVISGGYSTNSGGNVFVHRSAELIMSGDARIEGGEAGTHSGNVLVDGKMSMTDNALVTGGKAGSSGGNICVNVITSGGVTYNGQLTMSGKAAVKDGKAATNGGNINMVGASVLNASGDVVISGGEVCGSKTGVESTGGNLAVVGNGSVATLSGNVKILDGVSYHTGGNLRISAGATVIIKDNVLIDGGKSSNGKSDTSKAPNASNSNANIFCVNGAMEIYGGTITGNANFISTTTDGCTIKLSGAPVINKGASGYGLYSSVSGSVAPAKFQVVGAMTGEAGSVVIGFSTRTGIIGHGTDYTLTDADAAVFASDRMGAAADCWVFRDGNNLVVGKGECLCGQEEHTKACKELWNGENRIWTAWTNAGALPTTSGNYYLTTNVDFKWQQKIAKDANIVLDLNGYTVTNSNGQRMYVTWESGGNLTITDKSQAQTGKLVGSGNAVDQGLIWVRNGTFNLVAGTIDASGYNLSNVWSNNAVAEKNGGAIWVNGGTTFNMYGGTVIGANCVKSTVTVDGTEKSIYAPNGATISSYGTTNIYDGIIRDGKTENEGGNVYVSAGTFTMYGGQVLDGTAVNGGNFRIAANGNVILKEGVIVSGGEATTGRGGNFQVQGKLTIDGAQVKDSVSGNNGGNIYISSSGTVTLKSGTVSGGWSKNVSGNVHIDAGKFIMTGGTVSGGKTGADAVTNSTHANVQSVNGTWEFLGGTVEGNSMVFNYDVNQTTYPTTVLGGNATINGNLHLNFSDGKAAPVITVNDDFAGSVIITSKADGIITTTAVTEEQAKCFTSGNSGKGVYRLTEAMGVPAEDVGKLYVGVVHCVCGASLNGGEHDANVCDGSLHIWKPTNKIIDSDGLGADQYYYLTGDTTVSSNTTLHSSAHNVTYDLNGHKVTVNGGRMFTTYKPGNCTEKLKVTVTNTGKVLEEGNIVVNNGGDEGRIIWLTGSNKTAVFYNVNINISNAIINKTNTVAKQGVAFCVGGWNNSLSLYKVNVVGGTSQSNGNFLRVAGTGNTALLDGCTITGSDTNYGGELGGNGGALNVGNLGVLTLTDTTVTGNNARVNGGGVYVEAGGKLVINGNTKITGNTVGTAKNNVYVADGGKIEVGTLGSEAQIGLSADNGVILSTDVTHAEMDAAFTADNAAQQQLVRMADGMSLQDASAHIHCVCGGTIASGTELPDGTIHTCVDIVYTAMNKTNGSIGGNTNWYLADDVELNGQLTTQNYVLNLCLNGKNITQSNTARMIRTYCSTASTTDDNRIVLTSCQPDVLVDGKATNNSIIKKAGTFSDDTDGGIFWITSTGTVEMYAGNLDASGLTLKPNADDTSKHGTAIKIESGSTFKMYGGTIYGGKTLKGTNNNSEGACIFSTGNIILNGGKIVGGETVGSGGSLFLFTGSVTKIYGGTVTGGKAANNGGNIHFEGKELLIAGGTIEKGTAGNRGGNVWLASDGATISGGTVKGGNANDGGNLALNSGKTMTMTGGTIDAGSATAAGGNVWLMGTMNMSGGRIANGAKGTNKQHTGANMNMNADGVLNISGGHIEGRVCAAVAGAKVNISGSAKIYGTDQTNNLYVDLFTITVSKLNADAKIGLLILNEGQIGTVATIADGVTIDPAQFPVFGNDKVIGRKFAAKQDGTSLVIYEVK